MRHITRAFDASMPVGNVGYSRKSHTPGTRGAGDRGVSVQLGESGNPGVRTYLSLSTEYDSLYLSVGFRKSDGQWINPKDVKNQDPKWEMAIQGMRWKKTGSCLGWKYSDHSLNLRAFGNDVRELLDEKKLDVYTEKLAKELSVAFNDLIMWHEK